MTITIQLDRPQPRNSGRLRRKLRDLAAVPARLLAVRRHVSVPVPVAVGNLAKMPLTVAGCGCVAAAAFTVATGLGLLVLAGAFFYLEFLAADE